MGRFMRLCIKVLTVLCVAMALMSSSVRTFPDAEGGSGRLFADTLRMDSIARDTDLWTCGQLIEFSCKAPVYWDEHGRVASGMLGINTIILCADNKFREFSRGYNVSFDERGLLVSGTPSVGIEITVQEQLVLSMPYTDVSFYPNGTVRHIVPSESFRYATADGFKFSVAAGHRVVFDMYGRLRMAVVARRRIMQRADGSQKVFQPGDEIVINELGRVE